MIRQFRTISALMRHDWLIEPVYAEQHLPILNAYLSGQFLTNEDIFKAEPKAAAGFYLTHPTPSGVGGISVTGSQSATSENSANLVRYELNGEEELPDNSVFVLDIRGAIFKEGSCCAYGTEDYARLINDAYANPKIVGVVCLIDSPGGQLSGTPTLYDAIRNPAKPTVSVVNEGLMASAAYWLACGSDFIYATQQTDQIGSIGVFVQFRDSSEAAAKMGIKTVTVYSDRSSEKNLPFRNALAGDTKLLREDLNQAADLFRAAVEAGRGDRLKPATKTDDVFKGGLFYAGKAIELGLIDGYGNLDTAVAKVLELASQNRTSTTTSAPVTGAIVADNQDSTTHTDVHITAPIATGESNPNPNQDPNDMFGFTKLPALAAVKGIAAADITAEQIDAINAELSANGFNIAAISESDFTNAQALETNLATATTNLTTATSRITELEAEVARLGEQPGAMGSKSKKEKEAISEETIEYISETDAELARLKGQKAA